MRRFMSLATLLCLLAPVPVTGAPRTITRLDSGWRFSPGEQSGAEKPEFNDRSWEAVSLPHNWGWEEAQKGMPYRRGPGWYRRILEIPGTREDKRFFLRFDAAGSVADVFVNGTAIGSHRGAFGAFCFEITPHLKSGGGNLVAVRVSNAAEPDVAPLSGDFDVYGGLYRPAWLIETNRSCISPADHASPGAMWRQTSVSQDSAVIDVEAHVSYAASADGTLLLRALVLDPSGSRVSGSEDTIAVTPNSTAPYSLRIVIHRPRLWDGRKDPFLYRSVVELRSTDGILLDTVERPLGLRSYRIDPDSGFFLNGRPYHLHGVNRHQDRPGKGWAISEADMREDLDLVMELGCTVVRCAHYQHSGFFYSLCDSAGLLVWAELPLVDEINPSNRFAETTRSQLVDLIRQNAHHPSIFAWSLFNELWPGRPDPHRLLQDLQIVARGEDPTRPTVAATATEKLARMNKIPDLLGWNIYPGWYPGWGPRESFGEILDRGRMLSRGGGICVSEYGAGANVAHHEQNAVAPKTDGQWHPEEWQALVHESGWSAMKARPFIWGTFVWNMFDFTSASRKEGAVPGRNDKGLVTFDRKTKKDAFFFYKAEWSDEPVLYIASRRHSDRAEAITEVKVYSNADTVELMVNGVSQGRPARKSDCIFLWKGVSLRPGENTIQAKALRGGLQLRDECAWSLTSR
jgi:beta-galactosidase